MPDNEKHTAKIEDFKNLRVLNNTDIIDNKGTTIARTISKEHALKFVLAANMFNEAVAIIEGLTRIINEDSALFLRFTKEMEKAYKFLFDMRRGK